MEDQNYLQNAQGHLVPVNTIKQERLLENDLVNEMHMAAENLKKSLIAFKSNSFEDLYAFIDILSQKYKVNRGGRRGNVSFTNYEGNKRIVISVQDFIAFGAELEIAKDLVNECIRKWLDAGVNQEIGQLVTHAFRVDNGRINVRDVLKLKQINIKDETWTRAMSAIDDAIRVESTKSYVRFQVRKNQDAPWDTIPLDLAKV